MANQKKLRKLSDEIWKKIPNTNSKYEVSNYGRVKSYCQNAVEGKVLNPSFIGGFKVVSVKYKGQSRHFLVHKLVAEVFIPKEKRTQTVVIHHDWNKTNNHVSNLQWVSKPESYKRMHVRLQEERRKKGKVVTYSKLKRDEVALIKSMLERGVKQKLIAKMFCVSEMQITRIKRGENWNEIEPLESKKPTKSELLV
jgi:hypothetical protein